MSSSECTSESDKKAIREALQEFNMFNMRKRKQPVAVDENTEEEKKQAGVKKGRKGQTSQKRAAQFNNYGKGNRRRGKSAQKIRKAGGEEEKEEEEPLVLVFYPEADPGEEYGCFPESIIRKHTTNNETILSHDGNLTWWKAVIVGYPKDTTEDADRMENDHIRKRLQLALNREPTEESDENEKLDANDEHEAASLDNVSLSMIEDVTPANENGGIRQEKAAEEEKKEEEEPLIELKELDPVEEAERALLTSHESICSAIKLIMDEEINILKNIARREEEIRKKEEKEDDDFAEEGKLIITEYRTKVVGLVTKVCDLTPFLEEEKLKERMEKRTNALEDKRMAHLVKREKDRESRKELDEKKEKYRRALRQQAGFQIGDRIESARKADMDNEMDRKEPIVIESEDAEKEDDVTHNETKDEEAGEEERAVEETPSSGWTVLIDRLIENGRYCDMDISKMERVEIERLIKNELEKHKTQREFLISLSTPVPRSLASSPQGGGPLNIPLSTGFPHAQVETPHVQATPSFHSLQVDWLPLSPDEEGPCCSKSL